MKVKKPQGKVMRLKVELTGTENLIEEAMFKALEVMKDTRKSLRLAYTIGCLAFNFEKDGEMLIELLYTREEILKMDFDKVELKSFIDNSYRFRTAPQLAKEVQAMHQQLRNEA